MVRRLLDSDLKTRTIAQMTDTWQNEVGNIKVNDRGMRVAQRDGQEELLLEGQVSVDACARFVKV